MKPLTKLALNGTQFVDGVSGAPVQLKGVAFASGVWLWTAENPDATSLPNVAFMQGESDFARVAGWGANVVTLYFSYDWFRTATSDGWAWLNQTLDWADTGCYVVPSLVVYPVGGLRGGPAFWASAQAKSDVLAMWQAFATRYKGRKEIVGLDVLNEPQGSDVPTIATYQTQLVDTIRAVDPGAIVFIEPMWGDAGNLQAIARDGLVYVSHYYEPMYYTGQGYSWISNGNVPVGTGYPGEMVMWTSSATASWAPVNPMRSGTSAWVQVQEDPVTVASSLTQVVYPYLTGYTTDPLVEIDIDDVEYAVLTGGAGSPSWHPVLNGDFEQTNDDAFHWNITSPANVQRVQDAATGNWFLKMQGCNVSPNPCTVALTDFWVGTLGGIPVTSGDQVAFRFRVRVPAGSGMGGVGAIYAYNVAKYWDKAAIQNSVLSKLVDFSVASKAPCSWGSSPPRWSRPPTRRSPTRPISSTS